MISTFEKAAKSALFAWRQNTEGVDDLVNELWVWYLESPATQKKLQGSDEFLARRLAYKAAMQILAKRSLGDDKFNGRSLYSSDSVKDALLGKSTNRYLVDILPRAMEALASQNEKYAEAIRSRYDDGVVPKENAPKMALKYAVRSLTEHVNVMAITAGVDAEGNVTEGPGSRHSVFPETRPTSGGHSDPTADIAILLIEHPEVRDEYLYQPTIHELLKGAAA